MSTNKLINSSNNQVNFDKNEKLLVRDHLTSYMPKINKQVSKLEDDDSDSDAPDEEDISSIKDKISNDQKQKDELLRKEKQYLKEKRRKQNNLFKQQQVEKRKKEDINKEKLIESEKLNVETLSLVSDSLPEELPETFFEQLSDKESKILTKPRHITFNDISEESSQIKQKMMKQRKKTLKQMRKITMKKGPVTLVVMRSLNENKILAPKKESYIINSKDKWLRRKAICRK